MNSIANSTSFNAFSNRSIGDLGGRTSRSSLQEHLQKSFLGASNENIGYNGTRLI